MSRICIDVHTHIYPPRYIDLLRARGSVPRIVRQDDQDRMLILPHEDADASTKAGRPIGSEYWDPSRKIAFMDRHGIAVSVLSPANPWLDFLPGAEAAAMATAINDDIEALCAASSGRFFGFGLLPTRDPALAAAELDRIARLPHLRGAVIGTTGAGLGLDDPALDVLWAAAEREGAVLFVHPHYGLGNEALGGFGHALPLALGFPFETAAAIARLILSGVLDRFPALRMVVAHAGGVLPYLAGRLDACVAADRHSPVRLRHAPSAYLGRLYYDAIGYQTATLACLASVVGADRILFGTDHPFFPPHVANDRLDAVEWHSPTAHRTVIQELGQDMASAILHRNAAAAFGIAIPMGVSA